MRTVYLDIDTQNDFVLPAGALYVPGAHLLLPKIHLLNRHAVENGHALVSTADAHTEDDPEFRKWPHHCVLGTLGQQKPAPTIVGQPIVNKRTTNCFFQTELSARLDEFAAERYIVYGVVTEICVASALFGALDRGGTVELVSDAIRELSTEEADTMIAAFTARGGVVTSVAAVTARNV